jgi:hypothetical protein
MGEGSRFTNSQIGEALSIEKYTRTFETVHELAIAQIMCSGSRVDPDYP